MPRPLIGVCAAVEPASFGPWVDEPAVLLTLSYSRAIQRAGGIAALLPPDELAEESPDELLDRIDALILGGGSDIDAGSHGAEPHAETVGTNPERDRFELALARRALEREMPLLGICRGMQVMNVAAGGKLEQHLPDAVGHEGHRPVPGQWAEHEVRLAPGSLAATVTGAERLMIKSHHHQGIAELGEGFEATGWATEDETIETVELVQGGPAGEAEGPPGNAGRFTLGMLWHPEEDPDDRVIPALVERAQQ
jgi:putative glutamine amidotransferase